ANLHRSRAPTAAGGRQPALLVRTPHEPEYSLGAGGRRVRKARLHALSRLGPGSRTWRNAGTMTDDKPPGSMSRLTAARRDSPEDTPLPGPHRQAHRRDDAD